jgi:hypothetical protein
MAKRAKKPKLPASVAPHECVVLAIDTAQRSGWAVYVCGELVSSGEVDVLDPSKSTDECGVSGWDADRVCLHALWEVAFSLDWDAPYSEAVLVFERPFRGTTQGQWIGAWKAAWARLGGHKRRMVGVYPSSWRARVLGPGWSRALRDDVRRAERSLAQSIAGRYVGPDEATAVLIGRWGVRAGETAAVLPKRRRKAA